jgi:hypothetical protein
MYNDKQINENVKMEELMRLYIKTCELITICKLIGL